MRCALVVALIASTALAQGRIYDRSCDISSRRSTRGGVACSAPAPTFAFATSSGAGMGAVCAGTTPTGTKGETITLQSRTGVRACMKGNESSGIANGDLVILAANKYAVQYGGDGTGALGLSIWGERTNTTLRSQEIDTAPWASFNSASSNPTITADFAVAPDGTTTAERLQFPATTAAGSSRSLRYQASGCPTGGATLSCYFKGNSTSGTIDMTVTVAGGWVTRYCPFVSTSWTRCTAEGVSSDLVGSNVLFGFGNLSATNGQVDRAANDVLAWGCQCEAGYQASPYIPTTDATATRAAESATASYTASGSTVGLGAIFTPATTATADVPVVSMSFDDDNSTALTVQGAKLQCDFMVAQTHSALNGLGNLVVPAAAAASCGYASSSKSTCAGAYCKSLAGALTLPVGASTLLIGGLADGGTVDGTVKNVCADSSSTICRPSGAAAVACPYSATTAQKLALIGDSIMVGAHETKVAAEMNDRMCLSSRGVAQFAVSGSTIADCQDQYTTNIKGNAYAAVATDCGTNNLLAGESAAVAWGKMEILLADVVRDGGFHVFLGNITGCHGYSGCDDAKVASFNAKESDWCADAGSRATCLDVHTLIGSDSATFVYDPVPGDAMGNLCQPTTDYLHPNNYCTTKYADYYADAFLDAGL